MNSPTVVRQRPTGTTPGTVQNYGTTTGRKNIIANNTPAKMRWPKSSIIFIVAILAVVIYLEG